MNIKNSDSLKHKSLYDKKSLNQLSSDSIDQMSADDFAYKFFHATYNCYPSSIRYDVAQCIKNSNIFFDSLSKIGFKIIFRQDRVSPHFNDLNDDVSDGLYDDDEISVASYKSLSSRSIYRNKLSSDQVSNSILMANNEQLVLLNETDHIVIYCCDIHIADNDNYLLSLYMLYNPSEMSPQEVIDKCSLSHVAEPISTIEKSADIHLLIINNNRLNLKRKSLDKLISKMDIKLNYGAHFNDKIYPTVLDKLQNENKGIFLFHGKPGTGKSTFIKRLCYELCNQKKVIYVPSDSSSMLTNASSLEFFINNPRSVIVIEDAENIIKSRITNVETASYVSSLLNVSDGILSDVLQTQIILTFNIEKSSLDKAFLRPGRLSFIHEFKCLNVNESKELMKSLKYNQSIIDNVEEPMSIAEIYNYVIDDGVSENKETSIGFLNRA